MREARHGPTFAAPWKRDHHRVAGPKVGDGGSNLLDNTGAFMAANDRIWQVQRNTHRGRADRCGTCRWPRPAPALRRRAAPRGRASRSRTERTDRHHRGGDLHMGLPLKLLENRFFEPHVGHRSKTAPNRKPDTFRGYLLRAFKSSVYTYNSIGRGSPRLAGAGVRHWRRLLAPPSLVRELTARAACTRDADCRAP